MQHNNEPVVTMVTLGRNGRFGNQIFQYAFIKIYAKKFNLKIETPEWIGQYLFGQYDTHITNQLPTVFEHEQKNFSHVLTESQPRFVNVDFWGYFQFNARYYAPHKEYFYHLFKPVDEIEKTMQTALKALRSRGKTLVELHLRRGDYLSIQGRVFYAHFLKIG